MLQLHVFLVTSHPVGNAGDKVLDIELGGTALLAGGVGTFETSSGLSESTTLTQSSVLDVIKVMNLARTSLHN